MTAVRSSQRVHIGTSGWHYKHWRGTFFPADLPAKKWLAWYAERFDTVEIKRCFVLAIKFSATVGCHS